ncbi:MAG: CotH kinase family protein [Myxococcota bacterium]
MKRWPVALPVVLLLACGEQRDPDGDTFPFADGVVYELALELPPASVDALVHGGDYVPATFTYDGESAPAGVRTKGSSTYEDLDGKPSLKVSFSTFSSGTTFRGVERLTLNNMKFDETKLREAAAYRLYRQMGVPGPRAGYARVQINGEDYGLYSVIENMDENFLARAFPGDAGGQLYDAVFNFGDLTEGGVKNFELEEGDPATATAALGALVDELDEGDILDVLEQRFDLDATLAFLAVDLLSANWDGYSRNTNNFLLYHAPVADRWSFVPWGQDTAFRGDGRLYDGIRARVTAACRKDEDCAALLEERIRDTMVVWEEDDLHGWTERLSTIVFPACESDPRRHGECEPEDILDHLASRPDAVRGEIGP